MRHFLRTPGITLALLLTIALGVGSNVAVQGFVRGMQLSASAQPGDGNAPQSQSKPPETAKGIARVNTLLRIAAALVFLIACANVAAFLLGRASSRSQETSVRVALGAGLGQLVRGLLADSIVISLSGGLLGALLARWTLIVLPALLFEEDAERLVFAPDVASIVAVSAAGIGITILCGLLPVLAMSHDRPAMVLRRESTGPSIVLRRIRVALVVAQMTSCCVLVVSTAFLLGSLQAALRTNAGQRLGRSILASAQASSLAGLQYFDGVERAARSVSGVSTVAWVASLPGAPVASQTFRIEPQHLPARDITLDVTAFTSSLLELFKLTDQACRVAVANEDAARTMFGKETAGRSVEDPGNLPVEIIGVLGRKEGSRTGGGPTLYFENPSQAGVPAGRTISTRFRVPIATMLERVALDSNIVSRGYFASVGWSLVAGGMAPDPHEHVCRFAWLNEEAARLYFHGKPVGTSVIDAHGTRTEIIGVVHSTPLGTFERNAEPAIYFPMSQDWVPYMTLILDSRRNDDPVLAELRSKIEAVPGRGPAPVAVKTFETYLRQSALAALRIATMIIGVSAAIALLLSILGLFGALNDVVRQRRREFAVRIALGAQRRHVIGHVLSEGGRLAFAGVVAGTLGSLLLARILTSVAPVGTAPALWVWMAAPVLLAVAVVLASVLPARRALVVNPVTIMRDE